MAERLAIFGGEQAVQGAAEDVFLWPIITAEEEEAVLKVLRSGSMSATDVTVEFEKAFAAWQGLEYALACNNGTAAIHAAMFGCGIGVGDEVIAPSITYWASVAPVFSLGATPVFAEVDPDTLCLDPADLEKRITDQTKAIVVVHYLGHPAEMDKIMAVAEKHQLKVIEDVSHAQGGLYKGRMLGTIGHVGAMSLMSGKSFPIGEGGILVTDDLEIYERALAFGHYERFNQNITTDYLRQYAYLPLGGYKYRMHQMSSAVGLVQLRHYDQRSKEIRRAMNYFWDLLDGLPGIRAHRVAEETGSNMAGWYYPVGLYRPEELGGLSVTRFAEAVRAEGFTDCRAGCNAALHTHPLFKTCDVYGHGVPTRLAHAKGDVRFFDQSLPVSEKIGSLIYTIPWFRKYEPAVIEQYAKAFAKVAKNASQLLKDDPGNPASLGVWHFQKHQEK